MVNEEELYLRGDAQYDYLHKNHPLKDGKFTGNILTGEHLLQKGGEESRLKDPSAHPTNALQLQEGVVVPKHQI